MRQRIPRPRMLAAMGSDHAAPGGGPILRFQPGPPSAPPAPGDRPCVVVDTTWSPPEASGAPGSSGGVTGLRDVAARVLTDWDLIAETTRRLDAWAAASGVVEALAIEGTSFWFYVRLRHWMWLEEQLLWLALVDDRVCAIHPSAVEVADGCDAGLVEAARAVAARDGVAFRGPSAESPAEPAPPTSPPSPAPSRLARVAARWRRWRGPGVGDPSSELARRRAIVERRLVDLSPPVDAHGGLLVVLEHAAQRVETPDGPRWMNAYLGPIVDRLRGTALAPIEVEIRTRLDDDAAWDRLTAPGSERTLPADVIWSMPSGGDAAGRTGRAEAAAAAIESDAAPLVAFGVDLGPVLGARVAELTRASFAGQIRNVGRLRSLLARLRPTAVLLADEYHRQEWLTAARLEGIPTVAVQHGMIYRWHTGYMHADRPPLLRLADRTYVFGDWERRMLTDLSVYRRDEVRVSGSPRLDLLTPASSDEDGPAREEDRASVRAELDIAPADRLVVISGTWGPIYRRFHYPIALAALVDRPLPGVHLVVKLHPGEPDEGPYRAVIEGAARSRGFAPPPVTIVQAVDLYRLLRAADAHVGVQSTVLTEAVATGTLNLLADTVAAADLLGYVEAGVAIPIRDGGDLLVALDEGPGAIGSPEARQAFLDDHFRPGSASKRIAEDLLAWPA